MRYRGALGWLVGLTAMLAAPGVAQAATVNSTADSGPGSLRQAIMNSAAGDTINFDPSLNGQTITLTSGALMISHTLTISGPGAVAVTVTGIDTRRDTVPHATSRGDSGGGGTDANGGAVDVSASSVRNNSYDITSSSGGDDGGGGIYSGGGGVSLEQAAIDGNSFT